MSSVPHIIHQIWYQGADQIPDKYKKYQESWKRNHPSWQYRLWDQQQIEDLVKTTDALSQEVYSILPHMIQKIDLAKYLILQRYGGVYADMDMESLRPLDELLEKYPNKKVFISEVDVKCPDHNEFCITMWIISRGKYSTGPYYNNGVLISIKGHPIWSEVLKDVKDNSEQKWYQTKDYYIQDSAGPMTIMRVMKDKEYENYADVQCCPHVFFEPCDKFSREGKCDTSQSYAVHHFANSWMSPFLQSMVYVFYHWQILLIVILVAVAILLFLIRG